jgi:hypothetical protein
MMINEATTSLEGGLEQDGDAELLEAYELLGVGPEADAQTVEAAYWRLAKQLALRRRSDAFAGEKLDQINWAYQTVSNALLEHRRRLMPKDRSAWWRRVAIAGAIAIAFAIGLLALNSYQQDIRDASYSGADNAQHGWNELITWLQQLSPGVTPTPGAPAPAPPASQ